VRLVLVASATGLLVGLFLTPLLIRWLTRHGYAQAIRDSADGIAYPAHDAKRGTPSMGGLVLVFGAILGYTVSHVVFWQGPTASGLLALFLMTGLGLVGFADDYIKIFRQRATGIRAKTKLFGQAAIALAFAGMSLEFPDPSTGLTPASQYLSFVRDTSFWLVLPLFLLWVYVMVASASNGVNLTDGLDGLATGASSLVFMAYTAISLFQYTNDCSVEPAVNCYTVRDPLDLAVLAAALLGGCLGFLWWNAAPARIFMGDTGSLALGGAMAGLAILSRTELLLLILGGLFVIIVASVIVQVVSFKLTGRRVLLMSPLQHHFELRGWHEITIVVRFWIIAAICTGTGMAVFYAAWLRGGVL
jgi:phospho-N-acetylmuramoyl-pentapeptide-transferase